MANIDITDQGGGGTLSNGVLQLENGVAMDTTLRYVADQANTKSQLLLATNATTVEGTLKIKTDNVDYIDLEDGSGNNRFTISRPALGQKVTLDFASNPVGSTTIVGAIRTFTDGTTLNDIVQFREDGQTTFVERVNVEADSLVTTQTSSVIASTTTNANLVIAPNGTGALVASIPDGTATGGNARGQYAVDLQRIRSAANQIAFSNYSTIAGGFNNLAGGVGSFIGGGGNNSASGFDDYQVITGGSNNTISQSGGSFIGGGLSNSINTAAGTGYSVISGGRNNVVSSQYGTVSGGQSNTASTSTHATVVGGQSNTSSGQHSVSGGQGNTASGQNSVAIGNGNISSALDSYSFGKTNNANGNRSYAFGVSNTLNGFDGVAVGSNNVIGGSSTSGHAFGISNNITAGAAGVAIGNGNTVSASQAVAVGYAAIANASGSVSMSNGGRTDGLYSITMGQASLTYLYSQIAHASGTMTGFSAERGTAQASLLTAFKLPTALTTGATTTLSLDGTGTTNLIIPSGSNRMWNVQVRWVAVVTAITGTAAGVTVGDTKTSTDLLAVAKRAGLTTVSAHTSAGTHAIETIAGSLTTANITYAAGASQQMAITFTGPTFGGGGSVTMRVVAAISLTEVAY